MKTIKGNNIVEINKAALTQLAQNFERVIVDLGTGDGRFVYKNALENPKNLYIGVDPAYKQMDEFSKRAVKRKLNNLLFSVGSFELLPVELERIADDLKIILPWGTLLKAVAEPTNESVEKMKFVLKEHGSLEIIFGYDPEIEPTQTARLGLEPQTLKDIKTKVIPVYTKEGFNLNSVSIVMQKELHKFESTWGKRISQRDTRSIFRIQLFK